MNREIKDYEVNYCVKIIQGGSKIHLFYKKNSPIYFRAFFNAGSKYDGDKRGLAHFTEHMLLAGTELYKNKSILNEKIGELGSKRNAYTGNNKLYFTFDVANKDDFLEILDIFDQIINYSTFNADNIEKERGVILTELTKKLNNPEAFIFDLENKHLFKGTEIEIPPLGTEESLKIISKFDLVNYYEKYIKNGEVEYFLYGDYDQEEVIKRLDKINSNRKEIGQVTKILPITIDSKDYVEYRKDYTQNYISLAKRIDPLMNTKEKIVGGLIFNAFGQGNTSRLNQILRNEKGLVYNVNSSLNCEPEYSFCSIITSCKKENSKEVISTIKENFEKLVKDRINQKELDMAKKNMLREIKFNYETGATWVGMNNMKSLIFDKNPLFVDVRIDLIKSVELTDVNNFIKKFLTDSNLLLSGIGEFAE